MAIPEDVVDGMVASHDHGVLRYPDGKRSAAGRKES
jgi:hypothetical protein